MNLFFFLNVRTAPRDYLVRSVHRGGSEVSAYIVTYILPFLVLGDVGLVDLASYAALIFIIGVIMTRDQFLHVNPLLAAFGLHLSTIVTGDGEEYFVISSQPLRKGTIVRAISLRSRILYER